MEKEKNSFYVYLQMRLLECCDEDKIIDLNMIKWKIINMKIPKMLIRRLLEEMEEMGLGKKIDKSRFKLNRVKEDKFVRKVIETRYID